MIVHGREVEFIPESKHMAAVYVSICPSCRRSYSCRVDMFAADDKCVMCHRGYMSQFQNKPVAVSVLPTLRLAKKETVTDFDDTEFEETEERFCEWCHEPLPENARPQVKTCSAKCRKARSRDNARKP